MFKATGFDKFKFANLEFLISSKIPQLLILHQSLVQFAFGIPVVDECQGMFF